MRKKNAGWALVLATLSLVLATSAPRADGAGEDEKRGCCSHHHGVCGCSGGTVICCDKEPSPSCTC